MKRSVVVVPPPRFLHEYSKRLVGNDDEATDRRRADDEVETVETLCILTIY